MPAKVAEAEEVIPDGRSKVKSMRKKTVATAFVVVLFGLPETRVAAWKAPQEARQQEETQKKEAPAPPQAQPGAPGPSGQRRPRARQLIPSIADFRGGETLEVMTARDMVDLDFSKVQFEADPVLIVDQQPVTRKELIGRLCLIVGSNEIDQFTTYILAQQIKTELARSGHSLQGLDVNEADLEKDIEAQKQMAPQMFGMKAEDWEKQIREAMGWERFIEFRKVQLGFEKIFLPDPPPGFREQQKEKLMAMEEAPKENDPGTGDHPPEPKPPEQLVPEADLSFLPQKTFELLDEKFGKMIKDNYARGEDVHPLMKMGVTMTIKRNLMSRTRIDFEPEYRDVDGREVLFTVEDMPVFTEEIFALIQPRLTAPTWRLALREIIAVRAVDKALEQVGYRFTPEQAAQVFQEMSAEYDKNPFLPLQQVAALLGFANVYHYRSYYERKAAYRKYVKATAAKEDVTRHYEKSGRLFFESGAIDGVVLFIPGERAEAEKKMKDALDQVALGRPFADLAREVGQYPPSPRGEVLAGGRMQPQARNPLRMLLGESEYLSFVSGYALSDEAFYRSNEDGIVGPVFRDHNPRLTGCLALQVTRYFTESPLRPIEEYTWDRVIDDLADLTYPRFVSSSVKSLSIALPSSH